MFPATFLALLLLQAPPGGLKIVVIAGEDAVNVIQQKSAVAPVIEVRDRNNLPVPGAVVTFSIEGGKAAVFSGGSSSMTIATNAAGRAAAAAINPLGAGSLHIEVSAAFQGQTVAATIAQTNVMTAAEAATATASGASSASGASGASSASGASGAAGAAGGGGGISATTIGIVGAAVGGGAVVATQAGGGDEPKPATSPSRYSGTFSGQTVYNVTPAGGATCTNIHAFSGTMTMSITVQADGSVTGTFEIAGTDAQNGGTCPNLPSVNGNGPFSDSGTLAGSSSSFGFRHTGTSTQPSDQGAISTSDIVHTFTGSVSGATVTGSLTHDATTVTTLNGSVVSRAAGSVAFPITLRQQ